MALFFCGWELKVKVPRKGCWRYSHSEAYFISLHITLSFQFSLSQTLRNSNRFPWKEMRLEKKRKEWKEEKKSSSRHCFIHRWEEQILILPLSLLFLPFAVYLFAIFSRPLHQGNPFIHLLLLFCASYQVNLTLGADCGRGKTESWRWSDKFSFSFRKKFQSAMEKISKSSEWEIPKFLSLFRLFSRFFFFTPRPPLNFLSNHKARISILLIILNAIRKRKFPAFCPFSITAFLLELILCSTR